MIEATTHHEFLQAEVPYGTPNKQGAYHQGLSCSRKLTLPGKAWMEISLVQSPAGWHAGAHYGIQGTRADCFQEGQHPSSLETYPSRLEALVSVLEKARVSFLAALHGDAPRAASAIIRFRRELEHAAASMMSPAPPTAALVLPSRAFTIWTEESPSAVPPRELPTADLVMHPLLARIAMMPDLQTKLGELRVRKPEHDEVAEELGQDWAAFVQSIAEHGVLEPIKVCLMDGIWHIADGRHRHRGALEAGRATVPVEVISPPQATLHIESTVYARRSWSKGMKAYLAVLMHPEVVDSKPGGDRQSKKHSYSVGMVTRADLSVRVGVSLPLLDQACEIYKHCESSAKIKEHYEWRIFTGSIGLGALLAGIGAELAGDQDETLNGRKRPETPWKHLCQGLDRATKYFSDWEKLSQVQQEQAETAFAKLLDAAPPHLRQLALEVTK